MVCGPEPCQRSRIFEHGRVYWPTSRSSGACGRRSRHSRRGTSFGSGGDPSPCRRRDPGFNPGPSRNAPVLGTQRLGLHPDFPSPPPAGGTTPPRRRRHCSQQNSHPPDAHAHPAGPCSHPPLGDLHRIPSLRKRASLRAAQATVRDQWIDARRSRLPHGLEHPRCLRTAPHHRSAYISRCTPLQVTRCSRRRRKGAAACAMGFSAADVAARSVSVRGARPFEHSSHGLLAQNHSIGAILPAARLEALRRAGARYLRAGGRGVPSARSWAGARSYPSS